MDDTGSVLPQTDIDVLFKQATGKSIARPPPAKPAAPEATTSPPASPVTPSAEPPDRTGPAAPPVVVAATTPVPATPPDDAFKTLQATVVDLAQRIARVETSISRLGQQEREVPDVSVTVQRLSQRLEAVIKELHKVNSQVGGVTRGLQGTAGYGIRSSFTCESCGSQGFVAIPMRCTNCGSEGWWGWWPKEK